MAFIFIFQKSRQPPQLTCGPAVGLLIGNPALSPAVLSAVCGELSDTLPDGSGGAKHSGQGALSRSWWLRVTVFRWATVILQYLLFTRKEPAVTDTAMF